MKPAFSEETALENVIRFAKEAFSFSEEAFQFVAKLHHKCMYRKTYQVMFNHTFTAPGKLLLLFFYLNVSSLTSLDYLLEVFFRLWIPSLVHISTASTGHILCGFMTLTTPTLQWPGLFDQ